MTRVILPEGVSEWTKRIKRPLRPRFWVNGDRQELGRHSLSIYDCILKRARCLEMKGTLSGGRPHRPPWSPQSCWLRLAFSLKAAPINCEGDPYEESYISPSQMWPHSVTSLKPRSVLGIFWLSHTRWHVISLKPRTHKIRRVHVVRLHRTALVSGKKTHPHEEAFLLCMHKCSNKWDCDAHELDLPRTHSQPLKTPSLVKLTFETLDVGNRWWLMCHIGHQQSLAAWKLKNCLASTVSDQTKRPIKG